MKIEVDDRNWEVIGVIEAESLAVRAQVDAVLDEIIDATSRLDWLLKHHQNAHTYGRFKFVIQLPDGERVDEPAFWQIAADAREYDVKIIAYINDIIAYGKNRVSGMWHDEEHPAGSFAINALVNRELPKTTFIRLYTDYLKTNDMEHEVHQDEFIRRIVGECGLANDDVLCLIAVRVSNYTGQDDQKFIEDYGSALYLALRKENKRSIFLAEVEQWSFEEAGKWRGEEIYLTRASLIASIVFAREPNEAEAWINHLVQRASQLGLKPNFDYRDSPWMNRIRENVKSQIDAFLANEPK
jgi:hypothetical protein